MRNYVREIAFKQEAPPEPGDRMRFFHKHAAAPELWIVTMLSACLARRGSWQLFRRTLRQAPPAIWFLTRQYSKR